MRAEPFDWQVPHVEHLIECLGEYPYALDASDTGTGKTFTSLFVCRELGISPFVITPKIVISAWRKAADEVGVELLDCVNIEKLKAKNHEALQKLPPSGSKKRPIANWHWNLPAGTFIIWDEVQNAGGENTQNGRALYALRKAGLPCLAMSATVAEDPMRLKALGYLLGIHKYDDFRAWCLRHGCVRNPWAGGYQLMFSRSGPKAEAAMRSIHESIFPAKGGRLRIEGIEDFPDCSTFAEALDLPDRAKVDSIYDALEDSLIDADDDEPQIVKRLRARQNVETLKTPLFVDLVVNALEEEKSAVVFVNFRDSLEHISEALLKKGITHGLILGGQSQKNRDDLIDKFQKNEFHVMLVMIQAGGLALSLHDLHGRPREAFIAPPDSAKDLKQALGRIHRAGAVSKAIQKIVFVANTVEERACENVRRKLNNLSTLNDGDLGMGAGF